MNHLMFISLFSIKVLLFFVSFTAHSESTAQHHEHDKHTILVVESYHAGYLWDIGYKRGLEQSLGDTYNLHYFEMDTKRIPPSEFEDKAEQAWQLYLKLKPSVVILGDDNAFRLLGPRFVGTKTKVVYLGINNNPRNYGLMGHPNITGVLERPLLKRSLTMLRKIIPHSRVLVLFDSGITAQVVKEEHFAGLSSIMNKGVQVDIKLIDTFGQWQKYVLESKDKGYDVIIIGLYHTLRNDSGQHVPAETVLKWTSQHTPLPPFAFWDFAVSTEGAIGGYVLVGLEQGLLAGELVHELLHETVPGIRIPKMGTNGDLIFSRTQLNKWEIKLNEEILPQASFRP